MTSTTILLVFLAYTALLFIISRITARKPDNENFFLGKRESPWYVVAYGMIGASLSGVTFISVPGWVGSTGFSYLVVVFGYIVGYYVIAGVLLPIYYSMNLTSIYTYLSKRFGFWSYKTGAFYFFLSRMIGASFRMFLVVNVLQLFVFDRWEVPFWVVVASFILLILLYTYRGGIKTIVWTDTLQTTFMLLAVVITILLISRELNEGLGDLITKVASSDYSGIFIFDWQDERFFIKQFISGAFIAIVMTGLDQDMMQKNLSCRNLSDAKKNVISLSWALVPVNLVFLFLGAVLFLYANHLNIDYINTSDDLFPLIALKYLGPAAGIVFIIGLIAAAYSSADSALTSLTTSFSIDFLGFDRKPNLTERQKIRTRYLIHLFIAIGLLLIIIIYRAINNEAIIAELFTIAGYTYGPLLGLYSFGLFTKYKVRDNYVPLIAIISPFLCYILSINSQNWLGGYQFGFELLLVNGMLTFLGLWMVRVRI